ncbi:MAG: NCS2 family permease [Eubacteriales bacterium]|nr:NCS2 family permease [Eubacteriales bacterium]
MDKLFKLKENGTTVRTELVAGLTTFMTMAYIIALNPNLIIGFGQGAFGAMAASPLDGPAVATAAWNGVFLATCVASAIAMFCMAFLANKPFALAPGMGLNSYFAVVIAQIAGAATCSYLAGLQAGLCIILIEGIVFVALSIFNVREKIVKAIPLPVRLGIGPGIGLMLMNIGFGSNAGVGAAADKFVMRDFFGALSAGTLKESLGADWPAMVLTVVTMFIGIFAIAILAHKKVKGAVLIGMLIASVVNWAGQFILGGNPFESLTTANWLPAFGDMAQTTLFKFDFATLFRLGIGTVVILILTFCMIDMFDTIGTVVATAGRAKMTDEEGNVPKMKEILLSDAIGTVVGSATGTSTVTTFIESASGVEAGGRTGLTALTTGILFLACIFIAPIAAIIPAAATSAALIYVGVLMLSGLKKIDFDDLTQALPVAVMLLAMPISGSIGHGIGLAMICYTVLKLFEGKAKEVSILTYIISLIFLVKFFLAI